MRKFVLSFLCACFAIALNAADWYLAGDGNTYVGSAKTEWSDVSAMKFADNGDGTFTLKVDVLAGEVKIKQSGSWDGSLGGIKIDSASGSKTFDQDGGTNITVSGSFENVTITFNPTTKSFVWEGDGADITPVGNTIYVLNTKEWENPTIYYWGNVSNTWPGAAVTPTNWVCDYDGNTYDVYSYTFTNSTPQYIIFNDGNGNQSGTFQYSNGPVFTCEGVKDQAMSATNISVDSFYERGDQPIQETVATPVISFANNTVTIACATDGAQIYFSTDGSTPSNVYSAPFAISSDCTVKAIAKKSGWNDSEVASKEVKYVTVVEPTGNILYFVDINNTYGSLTPQVHVWNANNNSLYNWEAAEENMTATGKYVVIAETYYPVWSYDLGTFDAVGVKMTKSSGGDLSFYNGALYNISDVQAKAGEFELVDAPVQTVATPAISCANNYVTISCATEGATIYYSINGGEQLVYSAPFAISANATVKAVAKKDGMNDSAEASANVTYTEVEYPTLALRGEGFGGSSWPYLAEYEMACVNGVYTITVDASQLTKAFKISDDAWTAANSYSTKNTQMALDQTYAIATADGDGTNMSLAAGASGKVVVTFDINAGTITFTRELAKAATFYMHFKNDWVEEGVTTTLPKIHIFHGENNETRNVDSDPVMTCVNQQYQIYAYEASAEEMTNAVDVEFYFENAKHDFYGEWYNYYRASDAPGFGFQYEKDRWTDFIFATYSGETNGKKGSCAVQSYMTYDQFLSRVDEEKEALYIVGESAQGTKWNILSPTVIQAEESGLFYYNLGNLDANSDLPRFKVSWVNVELRREGKDGEQRAWATFDLGVIGVNRFHEAIKDKAEYSELIDVTNQKTYFRLNESMPFTYLNQYDWTIKDIEDPASKYVVIDMHPDCQTFTVVAFAPNPSVTDVEFNAVQTLNLTDAQALSLHHHDIHLNAAETNGHVIMDKVNVCSGKATIKATSDDVVNQNSFKVAYELYMNGRLIGTREGNPGTVEIKYMAPGTGYMGARAVYTSEVTGLQFHSKLDYDQVAGALELPSPNASFLKGQYVGGAEGYGVALQASYSVESDYVNYADFTFDQGEAAELIRNEHWFAGTNEACATLPGWTYLADENNFKPENDWSTIISKENVLPVHLTNVVAAGEDLEDMTVSGTVYTMYPFLIDPSATFETVAAAAAPAARKAANEYVNDLGDDLSQYEVNMIPRTADVSGLILASDAVTGIEDVAMDADADAVLYNLQGVLVAGEPTPGIYLRRQGNTVTKVVIR